MQRTKKLPVRTKSGATHVLDTLSGMTLCGHIMPVSPYGKPVGARDLCGKCLAVLGAIWEPLARPEYERPPF